jgi:hypothetical protein
MGIFILSRDPLDMKINTQRSANSLFSNYGNSYFSYLMPYERSFIYVTKRRLKESEGYYRKADLMGTQNDIRDF